MLMNITINEDENKGSCGATSSTENVELSFESLSITTIVEKRKDAPIHQFQVTKNSHFTVVALPLAENIVTTVLKFKYRARRPGIKIAMLDKINPSTFSLTIVKTCRRNEME